MGAEGWGGWGVWAAAQVHGQESWFPHWKLRVFIRPHGAGAGWSRSGSSAVYSAAVMSVCCGYYAAAVIVQSLSCV